MDPAFGPHSAGMSSDLPLWRPLFSSPLSFLRRGRIVCCLLSSSPLVPHWRSTPPQGLTTRTAISLWTSYSWNANRSLSIYAPSSFTRCPPSQHYLYSRPPNLEFDPSSLLMSPFFRYRCPSPPTFLSFCFQVVLRGHRVSYQHRDGSWSTRRAEWHIFHDHICHEGNLSRRVCVFVRLLYQQRPRLPSQPPPRLRHAGLDEAYRCLYRLE